VRLEGIATPHSAKNNIFYGVNAYALYDDWGHRAGSDQNYNIYYRPSGHVIYWNSASYSASQFADYQRASGGQDLNSSYCNPLFTSISPPNFSLQSTSPAIGNGSNLGPRYNIGLLPASTWPNGVLTLTQGSAWNIGAFLATP
jgi:hypothetical protein